MEHKTVLRQVFEEFVKRLKAPGGVDVAVVARIEALLKDSVVRPDRLRTALFADEDLP